ncbi:MULTISPECIES: FAD-binding oxidoreductase [Glycomyces]|uniref:FAD-binding oxidoreductase n=2 Tax=Glycomyces TaxID=58113 RepID=A0A9X3PP45_9ACTN|nr:FAD-binding oxidoreductase [Glycomyces lechevalierae]MDA1387258.1 FAD-binding oxidoreductase [Glycomyces lechevalierae]MDR7338478.1 ring-1,2-phenylacetyl-CoA epoxidase subunit PaaE [Glycomyces lechevalierae]
MAVELKKPRKNRPAWHKLTVSRVRPLTEDAVEVTLAVPEELRAAFDFKPGQHLTFQRVEADGAEVRRSYSLASTPRELAERGTLRLGIRSIPKGTFSGYANRQLLPGDVLEVLPPLGNFCTDIHSDRHYGSVVAGSGITPIIAIATAALEAGAKVTLLYSNRTEESTMFAAELRELEREHGDRLRLLHVRTRTEGDSALLTGRLTPERLVEVVEAGLVDLHEVDEWFLCGPYEMVLGVKDVLEEAGAQRIHTELYTV